MDKKIEVEDLSKSKAFTAYKEYNAAALKEIDKDWEELLVLCILSEQEFKFPGIGMHKDTLEKIFKEWMKKAKINYHRSL
jgi:hypothetical protein